MNNQSTGIFKKDLTKKHLSELTFDSVVNKHGVRKVQQSAWIEINDLKPVKASNRQLPKGLKLSLIVYCGKPEFVGKSHLQSMSINNHGGKKTASIFWKVESIDYLMGIATSLRTHESLNLFVNLDEAVTPLKKDRVATIAINHLSITLGEKLNAS